MPVSVLVLPAQIRKAMHELVREIHEMEISQSKWSCRTAPLKQDQIRCDISVREQKSLFIKCYLLWLRVLTYDI